MVNRIIITLGFIGVCILLLFIVNTIFNRVLKWNNNINLKFIKSFIDVVLVVIFCYVYFSQFEVTKDISKTLLQSGTLLIALVTFAAQRVLSNVISGIVITTSKPFNIGDKIKVVNSGGSIASEGIIIDINLRHTIIKRYDGQCDIIPNSIMDDFIISNTNLIDNVGNFIEVEISYDSDIDLACSIIKNTIVEHPLTLNKEDDTFVSVKDFSSNGIILRVLVVSESLDNSFKACSEIRKMIINEFNKNGVSIPYTTVTILKG